MIAALLLALAQASAPLPTLPPAGAWGRLPRLPLVSQVPFDSDATVAVMELVEGRPECRASAGPVPVIASSRQVPVRGVYVPLAVLVAPDGRVLAIVVSPRPCDAIRTYLGGVAGRRLQDLVHPPGGTGPAWYRTGLGFSWGP